MKRTPPLLALLAVAVQLAGLGLCVWVMSWHAAKDDDEDRESAPPPDPAPPAAATPAAATPAVVPVPGPQLVAPPPGDMPLYILELAERTTQIVRGHAGGRWLTFGFYADGNIRMVDVDGGRYEGRAVSARAEMKEAGGTRSFQLQIGVGPDGRLQATFLGGSHDAETLLLEPIAERPVA